MKRIESNFIKDLTDPARRAAAIPKARRARTIFHVYFLVAMVTMGVLSAVFQLDSIMLLAFGALMVAIVLYLDVLVKILLAFEAANIDDKKRQ